MKRYIALLRGINVGGHRVKMDRLREPFEALDVSAVSTYIASGNVLFESNARSVEKLERAIETHLEEHLGYAVDTFVRTPQELATIASCPPFAETDFAPQDYLVYVLLLRRPPSSAVRTTFDSLASQRDTFGFAEREIYWLSRGKMSDSPLFGATLAKLSREVPNTMRNLNTMRKLAELASK